MTPQVPNGNDFKRSLSIEAENEEAELLEPHDEYQNEMVLRIKDIKSEIKYVGKPRGKFDLMPKDSM